VKDETGDGESGAIQKGATSRKYLLSCTPSQAEATRRAGPGGNRVGAGLIEYGPETNFHEMHVNAIFMEALGVGSRGRRLCRCSNCVAKSGSVFNKDDRFSQVLGTREKLALNTRKTPADRSKKFQWS